MSSLGGHTSLRICRYLARLRIAANNDNPIPSEQKNPTKGTTINVILAMLSLLTPIAANKIACDMSNQLTL